MTNNCANPECDNKLIYTAHNKKYCSPECRRLVTNKRVLERYHEGKKEKSDKRVCRTCTTVLSRYNPDEICGACKSRKLGKKVEGHGVSQELVDIMYERSRRS